MSPNLFNIYTDDLFRLLRKSGVGCHINSIFLGAIMFADDLVIVSPTRGSMQRPIEISQSYCLDHGLIFNTAKTKSMIFGKGFKTINLIPLLLNNQPIEYVSQWKYLGCLINSGKEFSFSCKLDLRTFRRSANSILFSVRNSL